MKEFLSRIGIGSAKVDTVLPKEAYQPGETVEARVDVEGGSTEQKIEAIYLALVTRYQTEEGYESTVIGTARAAEAFTLKPEEKRSFPVTWQVPYATPLTLGGTRVWLKTGLDIDWAVDPRDRDHLEIEPDGRLIALFQALEGLGFALHQAECKRAPFGFPAVFAQELEFKPHGGPYADRVNEVELVCLPSEDQVAVLLEVDARARGVAGLLGAESEQKRRFTFQQADVEAVRESLQRSLPG